MDWEEYMDMLLNVYKMMHPEKGRTAIFGHGSSSGGGSSKDPHAMDVDSLQKNKGKGKAQQANSAEKEKRHCKICWALGEKDRAQRHNTDQCWLKKGNEHNRPGYKSNQGQTPKPAAGSSSNGKGQPAAKKDWKMRLVELLDEVETDKAGTVPAGSININSVSLKEIPDPMPAETEAPSGIDEPPPIPPSGPKRKRWGRRTRSDFPEGL